MTISFFLVNLTGNAVDALIGQRLDIANRAQIEREYGFDRPVAERFADFMAGAIHGDFGNSFRTPTPALSIVIDALPYTATLVFGAMLCSTLIAVPVAVFSVLRRDSWPDLVTRRLLMALQGVPDFVVALFLVLLFSVSLGWIPSFGVEGATSYILPIAALSLPLLSTLTRLLRSQLIEILGQEFITALRAKGLTTREVVVDHALRNALPPLISYLAIQVGWLLAGTILVEQVFGIPGIGQLAVTSTSQRDINVLQAVIVVVATGYVVLNLLADLVVYALDPRVRRARA
jgi:ABC-type dipeptide/oligopeptide/nickel transport system permease component